jgi:WD40 repeat protein
MARIALSFDAWKEGRVAPATVEVPVAGEEVPDSPQHRGTLRGHSGLVARVAFSPDGTTLAACTPEGEVKLWDVGALKERRMLKQAGWVLSLAFLPDGKGLAVPWSEPFGADGRALAEEYREADVKGYRGGVKLWDTATGAAQAALQREPPRGVTGMALSSDGKTLAVLELWRENVKDEKSAVTLWDLATRKAIAELPQVSGVLALAPDGRMLAVSGSGSILLWDVPAGRELGKLAAKNLGVSALAFAPDGKVLAAACLRGDAVLWDVATGAVKARLGHGVMRRANAVAFSPDGRTLAVALGTLKYYLVEPGEVVLWDVAKGQKRLTLRGHADQVVSLAFSPDGTMLASGGGDKVVKFWNVPPAAGP